jgi:hypothetical protein
VRDILVARYHFLFPLIHADSLPDITAFPERTATKSMLMPYPDATPGTAGMPGPGI